jgi:hypothetical protein
MTKRCCGPLKNQARRRLFGNWCGGTWAWFRRGFAPAGDHSLAEEVAQNVFTALAAKAGRLKPKPTLAGWLYRAAMLECSELMRNEQSHERKVNAFSTQALIESEGKNVWREALPVLDEAIDASVTRFRSFGIPLLGPTIRKPLRVFGLLGGNRVRPRIAETEPSREFLGGKFGRRLNDRPQRVAMNTGVFPIGVLDAPKLILRLLRHVRCVLRTFLLRGCKLP